MKFWRLQVPEAELNAQDRKVTAERDQPLAGCSLYHIHQQNDAAWASSPAETNHMLRDLEPNSLKTDHWAVRVLIVPHLFTGVAGAAEVPCSTPTYYLGIYTVIGRRRSLGPPAG